MPACRKQNQAPRPAQSVLTRTIPGKDQSVIGEPLTQPVCRQHRESGPPDYVGKEMRVHRHPAEADDTCHRQQPPTPPWDQERYGKRYREGGIGMS